MKPLHNGVLATYLHGVYWFVNPPYLRYAAGVLIVLVALWFDLRPAPTEARWFAVKDIAPGTALDRSQFQVRDTPTGLLAAVEPSGVAVIAIGQGDPLLAVHTQAVAAPEGWWAIELGLPQGTAAGTQVRIVVMDNDPTTDPSTIPGFVLRGAGGSANAFGDPEGTVAVPPDMIDEVATAAGAGRYVVLVDR